MAQKSTPSGSKHGVTKRRLHQPAHKPKNLEPHIHHIQKFESLGVLAGTVTHDINNLLAAIAGNANLALADSFLSPFARQSLEEIKAAGSRAGELTHQLLAYARQDESTVAPFDLNTLLTAMTELLQAAVSKKATLQFQLADTLPAVEADTAQIQQVIVALITNAAESFGNRTGTITIRTGVVEADHVGRLGAFANDQFQRKPHIMLEVTDTGCGMNPETMINAFEPFFTTKAPGRGLGLAAARDIAQAHKGRLWIKSDPGQGTVLTLFLPSTDQPVPAPPQQEPTTERWHGTGTILVVDDEPLVGLVAKRILEWCGFTVLSTGSAIKALELFVQHTDEISAVLLDVSMPEMSGEELLYKLREINPNIPAVFSSGHKESHVVSHLARQQLAGFIPKPFEVSTLRNAVRQALGQ